MPFSIGGVLSRSFSVMLRNLFSFAMIGFVLFLPVFVLAFVLIDAAETEKAAAIAMLLTTLLGVLTGFALAGAIAYGVFKDLGGSRAGIGECLAVGFRRMLPVLGVVVLSFLCVLGGLFLLIFPAFIVYCMLYVAIPAAVVEAPGVLGALRRSAELTRGHKWSIFGIILLISFLGNAVSGIFDLVLKGTDHVVVVLVGVGILLLMNLYQGVCSAVAYFDLRRDKEGIAIDDLIEVFN